MEKVVSGIRPTGNAHLGNYFGALKNFVEMQKNYDCYYFVADLHSLTTHPNPADLNKNVEITLAEMLACGVDPEKATVFVQSDIPQIPELYLIMNMLAYKGELERVVTFKDKVKKQENNVNAGLLTYPVLMAVDILIHRPHFVPVGKDQQQHLEMTRTFGNRFNQMYNVDIFPEPQAFNFNKSLVKVPGLDGSGKMGKSEGEKNAVYLSESPESILKKVKRAVTDSGPTEMNSQKPEIIQNLFDIMALVSSQETIDQFNQDFNQCQIRYGEMKVKLAEDIIAFTTPIRERIEENLKNSDELKRIRKRGAEKAVENAEKTLKRVRETMGFYPKN